MTKRWLSAVPKKCDICGDEITEVFIDGKTTVGPWAFMCEECHQRHGCGLGLGVGQRYVRKPGGKNYYMRSSQVGPGRSYPRNHGR